MAADTAVHRATEHTVIATRLGELTIVRDSGALTGLYFPRHWPRPDRATFGARTSRGFEQVTQQLDEYITGDRSEFNLPIRARGTEFQRRVWDLITQLPYGRTTSYGELARRVGDGVSPQEVGPAVGQNPLCILIPCHRVIGSTGKLTGYAGGLGRKRSLLEIEQPGRASGAAAAHGTGRW
jgi:methylated-DNA-[protein]-cysteine S-methyltransferase